MTNNEPRRYPDMGYRMIVSRQGESFRIEVPELSILVQDGGLQGAYDKAAESCEAALREYRDAGIEDKVPDPRSYPGKSMKGSSPVSFPVLRSFALEDLLAFTAKTVVVAGATAMVLLIAFHFAFTSLKQSITKGMSARAHIHMLAERLKNSSPEQKEQLRQDLRVIAAEIRPLLEEFTGPPK